MNKLYELHSVLYNDNFDTVLVTETWLYADVSSSLLDPKSLYAILRKDRAGKKEGESVLSLSEI